jgi:hypothetical protein
VEVFQDPLRISSLFGELVTLVKAQINDPISQEMLDELADLEEKLICKDLLQDEFSAAYRVSGKTLSYIMNDPGLARSESFAVEIYRTKEDADFCNYYLNSGGSKDLSIQNLTRFLEMGGKGLKNRIRIVE